MSEFDKEIGLDYLRAMHLSDSRTDRNSMKDYHQNWTVCPSYYHGLKFKFIDFFVCCCSSQRSSWNRRLPTHTPRPTGTMRNIPLILVIPGSKQPKEVWGKEIETLQALTLWGDRSRGQLAGYVVPSDGYDKTWLFWSLKKGWCFWNGESKCCC